MGRKIVNFLLDEEVTECMKKYSCLYDKLDKFFKRAGMHEKIFLLI